MDKTPREIIEQELLPDESIIWYGQPNHIKFFFTSYFLHGLVFIFFAVITAIVQVTTFPGADFNGIFQIAVILIGLYVAFVLPFVRRNTKKYIYYAITNTRILSIVTSRTGQEYKCSALYIAEVPGESARYRSDGTGSIYFGPLSISINPSKFVLQYSKFAIMFCDIDSVTDVFEIYKNAKLNLK